MIAHRNAKCLDETDCLLSPVHVGIVEADGGLVDRRAIGSFGGFLENGKLCFVICWANGWENVVHTTLLSVGERSDSRSGSTVIDEADEAAVASVNRLRLLLELMLSSSIAE